MGTKMEQEVLKFVPACFGQSGTTSGEDTTHPGTHRLLYIASPRQAFEMIYSLFP